MRCGGGGGHLCQDPGCLAPAMPNPDPLYASEPYQARQYWIGSGNVRTILRRFRWASAGHFGCTVDPLNKQPVTQFLFNDKAPPNCQGTLSNSTNSHRVPNFRSDHPGGGNFALGDASTQFIRSDIDKDVYMSLSTISGNELAH